MKNRPARDALTIFYNGEEVPGIIVYGLANRNGRSTERFPEGIWPGHPSVHEYLLYGTSWEVKLWEIPIAHWPEGEEFSECIRSSLSFAIDSGCRVAWTSYEGNPFCEPPDLFDHLQMSGSVLAWMTDDARFVCPLDPDKPLAPVPDIELDYLRKYAVGLADVQ